MTDLRGYLKPEQVERILSACKHRRDRLMFQLMYRCGRRVSEVLDLVPEDIMFDEGKIIFNIKKKRGRKVRELKPVDKHTMSLLKEYMEVIYPFDHMRRMTHNNHMKKDRRLFPITRKTAWETLKKVGKSVGIERVGSGNLHPHHLRHSFAVHQVQHNIKSAGDLRKLQRYMGHSNISATMHYLQYSTDDLKDMTELWDEKGIKKKKR